VEKVIYELNESIRFDNILSNDTFAFEIEYWVEDLFGNEAKERYTTANLNKKQFSPDFEETDKVYFIKSNLTKIFCNNSNNSTFSEALVIVKGEQKKANNQSTIKITGSDEETAFGEILDVDLDIFKGDTRKTLVEAYIKGEEKISHVTGIKINQKYSEVKVSLPIQLKDNCDKRYKEGDYLLIIEGIDSYSEKQVHVKNNEGCPEAKKTTSSSSSSRTASAPSSQQPKDKAYELLSLIQDVFSSEVISTVRITNKENKSHSYEIWSYLYKGATSYSGEREGNKQKISLGPFSDETVSLRSKVSATHPEELLLKIKILREDRKTPYEITENITIINSVSINNTANESKENLETISSALYSEQGKEDTDMINALSQQEEDEKGTSGERITGSVIYESKSEKIKGYGIVFLVLSLILGVFAFVKLRPGKGNIY
jgi:hypothetical protein